MRVRDKLRVRVRGSGKIRVGVRVRVFFSTAPPPPPPPPVFAEHFKVKKFHWDQSKDNIGVCLDGDPTDAGTSITVEHLPQAWRIMAPTEYPRKVPDEMIKVGKLTKPAAAWLAANPPPEGTFMPSPGTKPPKAKKEKKSKKSKEGSSTV